MAQVQLDIGGRRYAVSCRDGEERQLRLLGDIVAAKTDEARRSVGEVNEVRQLLFAALLLADEVQEQRQAASAAAATAEAAASTAGAPAGPDLGPPLGDLLERLERLADALEAGADSA